MVLSSESGGLSILVADDDPGVSKLTKEFLTSRGFAVTVAFDGISACEQAEAAPPSLVLLDLLLPKRDGYAVLLHLRSSEATRNIPVILMSGESESEQAAIARALGAHSFLAKPFMSATLFSRVEAALNSKSEAAPPENI